MGVDVGGKVAVMTLAWLWPWAAVALLVAAVALVVVIVAVSVRRHRHDEGLRVFSLDDDTETEHASKLFHQWRLLNRGAVALLTVALLLAVALSARPAQWMRTASGQAAATSCCVWMSPAPRCRMTAR